MAQALYSEALHFPPTTYGCGECNCGRKIALVITVTTFVVGLLGSFMYSHLLQVSWSGVGTISQTTALCLMLTGFIISFIGLVLLIATCERKYKSISGTGTGTLMGTGNGYGYGVQRRLTQQQSY